MSTATFSPIAGRFAWKEYRMLRGFWLAVAALTVLEQWLSTLLAPPGSDVPVWLFASALFAAVLYAVGAAATSFAVEREEETYDYLAGLPTTWPAVLVGKLLVTLCSALTLAAVLAVVGWALGGAPRSATETQQLIGLFGMAIFEAVAWGTLFSLLVKRPLVAAVLTLFVTTAAIHLAVNATSNLPVASIHLQSYVDAIPLRLSIVAGVLLMCTLLARRWLAIGRGRAGAEMASAQTPASSSRQNLSYWPGRAAGVFAFFHIGSAGAATRLPRRRMFARLTWQSWRESWLWLLVVLPVIAMLLWGMRMAVSAMPDTHWLPNVRRDNPWIVLIAGSLAMFPPALCGALVFYADQRRRSYRFLAEHAAVPRWIWLARLTVWGLTSLVIWLLFSGRAITTVQFAFGQQLPASYWPTMVRRGLFILLGGASAASLGLLVAFAAGQLCSMLLRSAIMATFLALLLAIVVAAWTDVVALWGLSGWLFLFPLAVGLLAATWFRAPDWIEERSSWRAWWKLALAIVAPIVLIGCMLPAARLAQLPDEDSRAVAESVEALDESDIAAARKTGAMYLRALGMFENLADWHSPDPLDLWHELHDSRGQAFDESKIPAGERDSYRKAVKQHQDRESNFELLLAASRLVVAASRRPTCRFDIDWSSLQVPAERMDYYLYNRDATWLGMDSKYVDLTQLAEQLVVLAPAGSTVDQYIAALRMCVHLRQQVPTAVLIYQLRTEQSILESFAHWAQDQSRTDAELSDAIEKLEAFFQADNLSASKALSVDRDLIREVIEGRQWPQTLSTTPMSPGVYLAYLANDLPWERQRALRALDLITTQNAFDAQNLLNALGQRGDFNHNSRLRNWLRPRTYPPQPDSWLAFQPAAATSYLVRYEYEARVPMKELFDQLALTEAYRRATLLQIALARYRLAHNQYPESLAELVPNCIDQMPIDPYSGRPFEYRAKGLDLPLWIDFPHQRRLAPYTPVFWSVGPGNAQIFSQVHSQQGPDSEDPLHNPVEITQETVYLLSSPEQYWLDRTSLVFPLPKPGREEEQEQEKREERDIHQDRATGQPPTVPNPAEGVSDADLNYDLQHNAEPAPEASTSDDGATAKSPP